MLQQLDFFLSPFPPPVTWGQPVIHIFSFFPLPRPPPLLSPAPSSPPQPAMTSAVLPPLFPRAAGKGKAVVPDCLVAPSAPRVAPASGGFMADARRPPPPRRHAPRSPPPPRRPAPRSSPPPGQPAVRSPAAVVRPYPSAPPPGRPSEPDPRRPADAAAGRPGGAGDGAFPLGARHIQAVRHDHRRGAAAPGAPRRRARPRPCAPLLRRRVAAAAGRRPVPPPRTPLGRTRRPHCWRRCRGGAPRS